MSSVPNNEWNRSAEGTTLPLATEQGKVLTSLGLTWSSDASQLQKEVWSPQIDLKLATAATWATLQQILWSWSSNATLETKQVFVMIETADGWWNGWLTIEQWNQLAKWWMEPQANTDPSKWSKVWVSFGPYLYEARVWWLAQ